jgi:hypothetical protein
MSTFVVVDLRPTKVISKAKAKIVNYVKTRSIETEEVKQIVIMLTYLAIVTAMGVYALSLAPVISNGIFQPLAQPIMTKTLIAPLSTVLTQV